MILTEECGLRVRDLRANLAHTRGRPMSFGFREPGRPRHGGDCRAYAAAGDLRLKFSGSDDGGLVISHESERDLGVLVSDFLENGSGGHEAKYSSDSDSGCSDLGHLADRVLFHKRDVDQCEENLLSAVRSILLSVNENDLHIVGGDNQCSLSCVRLLLAKHLRISGYDAAICSSKWQGFDKVPGGDHEYIDVVPNNNMGGFDRLIVDIDFRSHFEIARAVESYDAILSSLPVVYVGSMARLQHFLQIMADAAKYSLRRNSMPLPPWRSLAYLQAKWQSKYDRKLSTEKQGSNALTVSSKCEKCVEHLRRLKSSLLSETEAERLLKPIGNDKRRMNKSDMRRPLLIRYNK